MDRRSPSRVRSEHRVHAAHRPSQPLSRGEAMVKDREEGFAGKAGPSFRVELSPRSES